MLTFSGLNNRVDGYSYDANGDVLSDSLHSYAWDANGRPTTIDSATVTYDALGRMVEQTQSGVSTEIEYSPTGFKMQLLQGQSSYVKQFEPLPGGTGKVWANNGNTVYYQHADWLGSSRFASTLNRTMYNDLAYTPFGVPYAQAGSTGVTDISFAGNNEDTVANLYDTQFREYGIQGRWPSPDPAGLAAVNPVNPQSWNRYAYVENSPNNFADPSGLYRGGIFYEPPPLPYDPFAYMNVPITVLSGPYWGAYQTGPESWYGLSHKRGLAWHWRRRLGCSAARCGGALLRGLAGSAMVGSVTPMKLLLSGTRLRACFQSKFLHGGKSPKNRHVP